MKIACWNVRGFNKPLKQSNAQGLIKKHNLSILGLLEVKVKACLVDRMMATNFPGMSFIHNFLLSDKSRVLLMWNNSVVNVDLLEMTDQVNHVNVVFLHSNRVFVISFVYGLNSVVERRPLWDFLMGCGDSVVLPWMVLGDFNCVRFPHEKMGGLLIRPRDIVDLGRCISHLELSDVNHVGCFFTWSTLAISSKLDRVMDNHHWTQSNLDVFVDFLAPGCFSDHAYSVVSIFRDSVRRATPFKFFNMWTLHPDYHSLVGDNWFYGGGGTHSLY
ncbi:uncharacterized protein [Primulina huaijiensis]|uniref:uncharacterized protein n=1 Tax=Primulina huaijiensis TaxID=1492673 RepID=UPI003CC73205